MMTMIMFPLILSPSLMVINFLIAPSNFIDRENSSPFECGFDPPTTARLPFSLRFFLVTVLFLIFDVEITLMLPLPLIFSQTTSSMTSLLTWFFICVLMWGLAHEWKFGALDWKL